jgi:hypothetical protein
MADYVPAWIEIGGPVPRGLIPELIEQIQRETLRDDFGGSPIKATSADELLALAQDDEGNPGALKLYDERTHNGEFAQLESFLEEHGVAFNRHSDAGDEFSSEVARFRPGWPAPTVTLTDALGREMIPTEYVVEALEMLRSGKRAKAIKHLGALANEGVPPLEPLSFVG